MAVEIPLTAVPSQTLQIVLDGQNCTLALYQRGADLFMDLMVGDTIIWSGFICRDRVGVNRYGYLPFLGQFYFVDTQGFADPQYTGLGDRWGLLFVSASEIPPAGVMQ